MPELLGDHEAIAHDLFNRVKSLSEGTYDGPTVVLLRGASGVGKTAIIQRLYELLRLDGAQNGKDGFGQYWPELFPADHHADPLSGRALLSPELESFVWKEDTLPTFGWWSFNCENLRNNQKLDVVAAGQEQMATHLAPLSLAWWDSSGALERTGKVLSQVVTRVRKDLQADAFDSLLEASVDALSLGVPLPATLSSWLADTLRWFGKRRKDSKNLHRDVDMGEQHLQSKKDAGVELAEAIRSLTAKGLPGIVVVEDMHLMGPNLASLLATLAVPDQNRPVLIVGTAWPEGTADGDFQQWHLDMLDQPDSQSRILDVDIPSLRDLSLINLLLRYAPETSADVAAQVVEKLNTPLFLLLWVTDPNVAREIKYSGNKILLTDEFKLPNSVEQVVESRWNALPEDVRNALTSAVAGNPSDPTLDILNRFVPTVIAEVTEEIYDSVQENALEAINKARNPIGWCQGSTDVASFTDPLLTRHVRKSLQSLPALKAHAQGLAQQACIQWLDGQRDHLDLPNSTQVDAVVDWYLDFAEEGPPLTTAAVYVYAARRNMRAYEFSEAIECFNSALRVLGSDVSERDQIFVRRQIAECHYAMSEFKDAEAILLEVLPEQIEMDGESHPDTLALKLLQAKLLLRSGDPLEAAPVLIDVTAMLGDYYSDRTVPEVVVGTIYIPTVLLKAEVAFENLRNDEAIGFYDEALAIMSQIYGEDSLDALMLQVKRLRAVYAMDVSSTEAFEQGKTMLAKIQEASGADSPYAVEAEANVLRWGCQTGMIKDVEQKFRDLDTRIPQARSYATLRAEIYYAAGDVAGFEGRMADAKRWFLACLSVADQQHGVYDPLNLHVRHQLGVVLFNLQQFEEARNVLEGLTENARVAVGGDGRATVEAELLLSQVYAHQGRLELAISRLQRTKQELAESADPSLRLTRLVESRLGELISAKQPVRVFPLVQMKRGKFVHLSGTRSAEFPPIENQKIVIVDTRRMLDSSPEYALFHLETLARASMNLGACYIRDGAPNEAYEALRKAEAYSHEALRQIATSTSAGSPQAHAQVVQVVARLVGISHNLMLLLMIVERNDQLDEEFVDCRVQALKWLDTFRPGDEAFLGQVNLSFLKEQVDYLLTL